MNIFDEIKKRAADAEGKFKYSWEDLKKLRADDESKQFEHFKRQIEGHVAKRLICRSGILPLHQQCTVTNYIADTKEQQDAKLFAIKYIASFDKNNGSGFIFSGSPGTGKNHLSAGICNALMESGYTCLIISVTELMQKLRATYSKESTITEDMFIKSMVNYDLLVIDEIGLQRGTEAENITLNQIIDQRICRLKPTGLLTNLDAQQINDCLGVRIMDRMRSNGGSWISFEWESFRK